MFPNMPANLVPNMSPNMPQTWFAKPAPLLPIHICWQINITQWVLNSGNTSRFVSVMHFDLRLSCLHGWSLQCPALSIHSMCLPSLPPRLPSSPSFVFPQFSPPPSFPKFQSWRGWKHHRRLAAISVRAPLSFFVEAEPRSSRTPRNSKNSINPWRRTSHTGMAVYY